MIYSEENGSSGSSFTTLWTGYVKTHGKEVRINFFNLREVYLRLIILGNVICKRPLEANVLNRNFSEDLSRTQKSAGNCIK